MLKIFKNKTKKMKRCPKCGCKLFPEETMCPDCLFPINNTTEYSKYKNSAKECS